MKWALDAPPLPLQTVWGSRILQTFGGLLLHSVVLLARSVNCRRNSKAHDDKVYRSLCAQGLSFDNVIDHVEIPVADDEGQMVLQPWPILKPHRLATWLTS